jgi:hypothetical protein
MAFDFGKSSSYTTPELTQEQKDMIKAQTNFFTGTIEPTYQTAVQGATDIYNQNAGGVLNAAQNLAGTARQAGQTFGETGESALRTGVTGLESLFSPNYEANQIQAALAPAQAQYAQNIANQGAQFGGAGELGSARQALAGQQLAGANQAAQMQTAANIQQQIAAQRASAASNLANLGQAGLGQAIGAAGQVGTAAMLPQDFYNKYASIIFGTPSAAYNPNFAGTQGKSTDTTSLGLGIK